MLDNKELNYVPTNVSLTHDAVVWYEEGSPKKYSYDQLLNIIRSRAAYFRDTLKISAGDVVAVLAPRGPEYLINMLALWQLGAVYFPLSDEWKDRNALSNRLKCANAKKLITVSAITNIDEFRSELQSYQGEIIKIDQCQIPNTSELLVWRIDQSATAYIYSSSGTTDKPKLIALPHAGILDRIQDHIHYMKISQGDGVLVFLNFGFDASMVEMLLAICSGNTLYIAYPEVRRISFQLLPVFFKKHPGIHVAILMPSVLSDLKASSVPNLTKLVTMGETCLLDKLNQNGWFDQAEIYNGYGPTETTFGASLTLMRKNDQVASILRPMRGVTLYLHEESDSLEADKIIAKVQNDKIEFMNSWGDYFSQPDHQPVRVEILISSSGIGTYIGMAQEKIKQKFKEPLEALSLGCEQTKLYVTGDLADFNGHSLVYKGRKDTQFKRYGLLVTLDEVDSALLAFKEEIEQAAAIDFDNCLIAFLVPKNSLVFTNEETRIQKSSELMCKIYQEGKIEQKLRPNVLFWVKELKQTQNNKTSRIIDDYKKLSPIRFTKKNVEIDDSYDELITIWREILEGNLADIDKENAVYDIDTEFSYLGGDSLKTSRMIQRIWQTINKDGSPAPNDFARGIIANPTLRGIKIFLSIHNYSAYKLFSYSDIGLPIFSFDNTVQLANQFTLYQISLPTRSDKN